MTHLNARRYRRKFLASVPGPDSCLRALGELGVGMEVVPYKDRWEWRAWLTFGGRPSLSSWTFGQSWRSPAPHELRGRCRNQGDAWIAAREVANAVRALNAAAKSELMRRHKEHLPL